MNQSQSNIETLEALSQMPFLDCVELAAVTGLPERTERNALRRLRTHGHVEALQHTRSDAKGVKRYCLTTAGIDELVKLRMNGETARSFIAKRDLASKEGRRHLAGRLDAVESLYKIARDMAGSLNGRYGRRLAWRWERRGVIDALTQLPDGRTLATSRIGVAHAGKAISSRLGTLCKMHRQGALGATLLLVPGAVELQRALNHLRQHSVNDVFVATEPELLNSPIGAAIWHTTKGDPLPLSAVLERTPVSTMPRTRRPEDRRGMPSDTLAADIDEMDLTAAGLGTPAKRLMRLLYDWPFIRVAQMQRMMGVSKGRLRKEKGILSQAGLMYHLRIGRTPKQRFENETRMTLSRAGLRSLRRVDRSSPLEMKNWFVEPHADGDESLRVQGYRVSGNKARVLLKERRHTDGIYQFVSLLMQSCRKSRFWDLAQALPAHRWERKYRYGVRRNKRFPDVFRSIRPDATFALVRPDGTQSSFVLEFERRATSPSTMAPKIDRYKTYYASPDTAWDFLDGRPTALFVFEAREHAANFVRYAATDGGDPIPMLVSSLEDLEEAGSVFGRCWLMPRRLDEGYRALTSLT